MTNSTETLKLANDSTYRGNRSWSWNVWLEGSVDELAKVVSVEYILHPTFKNRVHIVTDRESKFRMSGSGWGEFNIHAEVLIEGGKKLPLNRWLEFNSKEKLAALKAATGFVLLSHSIADSSIANRLAGLLTAKGYQVTSSPMADFAPGKDWQEEIIKSIKKADVCVVFISPGMSEFIDPKIARMLAREKHIENKFLPVLLGSVEFDTNLESIQKLRISSISEIDLVVRAIETLIDSTAS